MKLKSLDKSVLLIIFILSGLYGFTDFNAPRDAGTFLGSAMVVMVLLGIGWLFNKILRMFNQYKHKTEKMSQKMYPTIALGLITSIVILISGIIELNSR